MYKKFENFISKIGITLRDIFHKFTTYYVFFIEIMINYSGMGYFCTITIDTVKEITLAASF